MVLTSLSPPWFFGYDVILELCFTLISLAIALFALRIYKATDQKQVKYFGISFIFVSVSYFIQSALNFLVLTKTDQAICTSIGIQNVNILGTYGLYAHIFFMMVGLALLAYMTFRTNKMRIMWLLLIVSLVAIFFSVNPIHTFFLISSLLLGVITWHFIDNYRRSRQVKTLLVVLAFIFLLFGSIHFIVAVDHELYYVIGHILEFFAYSLILANFYMVLRNGQKA